MLNRDQERGVVLLAFANAAGDSKYAASSVEGSLHKVGASGETVSHAEFMRIQNRVERLNEVLNGTEYYTNQLRPAGNCAGVADGPRN